MPLRYRIDPALGVVFVRLEGELRSTDLETYSTRVVKDPEYRPGLHELVDLRGAHGEAPSASDLRRLRDLNLSLGPHVGRSRLATVVDTDLAYGLGRMFMALSDASTIEHGVFRDMQEARAWLGLPGEEGEESGD